jgi:hypothetical protein
VQWLTNPTKARKMQQKTQEQNAIAEPEVRESREQTGLKRADSNLHASRYNRQGRRKRTQRTTMKESDLTDPKTTKASLSQTKKKKPQPTDSPNTNNTTLNQGKECLRQTAPADALASNSEQERCMQALHKHSRPQPRQGLHA